MNEHIDSALQAIEDDYKICLKVIGKYFDYLDTCGLKEFNKFSTYKWSYDRDRSNGYSYVCIRYGSSLLKKCLIKKRPYIESADLYNWVKNKNVINEALDEAWQYIVKKVNDVKHKIEEMKEIAEDYEEKLEGLSEDFEQVKAASKKLGLNFVGQSPTKSGEDFQGKQG
ncbi:MAG: hypothetical protein LBH43_03670 [Treponema sp.]|jgi:hypothetical protein|nr:hypothetical protein [Treponema sp.]